MNLARCNAHLLRGTLEKGEAIMDLDWIADKQIKQFSIQAPGILSAKIWNCPAKGVLGRVEGTFRILIKNAVVKGFCVPLHSYINENVNIDAKKIHLSITNPFQLLQHPVV